MVGHFTDNERVLQFINSNDLEKLAPLGTSCPDHFLRTKISPLVLNLTPLEDVNNITLVKEKLQLQFEAYRKKYMRIITINTNIRIAMPYGILIR